MRPRRHGTAPGGPGEERAASAADMIPDELWEILTGEKRRPAPVPAPEPEAVPGPTGPSTPYEGADEPEYELEDVRGVEGEAEPVPMREARPAEVLQPAGRAESLEVEPVIVSLEAPPPPAAQRHAAFHARIQASEAPRPRRRAGAGIRLRLDDPSELRRMVVLREVLGPPKALE